MDKDDKIMIIIAIVVMGLGAAIGLQGAEYNIEILGLLGWITFGFGNVVLIMVGIKLINENPKLNDVKEK